MPDGTTITLPPAVPDATRGAVPAISPFDEELRRLLRYRLILVHLLALAYLVLLFVLIAAAAGPGATPSSAASQDIHWTLFVTFAESLIGTFALCRWSAMSLRYLRLWELIFFGTHAACYAFFRIEFLAGIREGSDNELRLSFAFLGLASLQQFVALVLVYGVLIPNTRRRSLRVVAVLTLVPLAVIPIAAAVNPLMRGWEPLLPLTIQWALILIVPATIAVFAASRAAALQRRAFEAERRANELGQYTLKSKLGAGGMGEVWLAEHRLLKRPCAIKFIRGELAANAATAARFEREVQAVTALTHFNTVRVHDYGRADDGSFYYVMEFLEGPTLESLVKRVGPLEPGRVVYLIRQLCGALAEAHESGLVHRDVKPGNVIVASLGGQCDVVKLLDFGLVQDLATTADRLTAAGVVLGTPAYMSPEQAGGSVVVDARGDVYSLGAVAFYALTGRPPFEKNTVGEYIAAHLTQSPPRATDLRPDAPEDLTSIISRCLAKNPAGRFQTIAELDHALAGCRCASDWTAESARAWWAEDSTGWPANSASATGTYHHGAPLA